MNQQLWDECVKFHGHSCPGLAIGFRATELAMEKMGKQFSADSDEQIVCITENDACGVDAVQYISGCTLGKGNLIYRPTGKMAFSFFDRESGDSIRLMLNNPILQVETEKKNGCLFLKDPKRKCFLLQNRNTIFPKKPGPLTALRAKSAEKMHPNIKYVFRTEKTFCLDCFEDYDNRW